MYTYEIWHPVDGALNTQCEPGRFEYKKIYTLKSFSPADAYFLSQNDVNEEYAKLNCRSTSVGDIIVMMGDDKQEPIYQLVLGVGFKVVSPDWVKHIDWSQEKDKASTILPLQPAYKTLVKLAGRNY